VKQQTLNLLKQYESEGKLEQLSVAEINELVNIEYGQTLQSVIELYKCILRKYNEVRRR
jgi:hypothetical protein